MEYVNSVLHQGLHGRLGFLAVKLKKLSQHEYITMH